MVEKTASEEQPDIPDQRRRLPLEFLDEVAEGAKAVSQGFPLRRSRICSAANRMSAVCRRRLSKSYRGFMVVWLTSF